jgi:hypothetical protein
MFCAVAEPTRQTALANTPAVKRPADLDPAFLDMDLDIGNLLCVSCDPFASIRNQR